MAPNWHFANPLRSLVRLWKHGDPLDVKLEKLKYHMKVPGLASPLYPPLLSRGNQGRLNKLDGNLWPGSMERGDQLLDGLFELDGEEIELLAPTWKPDGASNNWRREMHSFAWLRDLKAVGDKDALAAGQKMVSFWIEQNRYWWPISWHPWVTGRRLHHWISSLDFLSQSPPAGFHKAMATSVHIQSEHLMKQLPAGLRGSRLITAAKGLVIAGLALPGGDPKWRRGLELIETAIRSDVAPDGFHIERCSHSQFTVLRDLIDLRNALAQAQIDEPGFLEIIIEKMAPALRFYILPDGHFSHLNKLPRATEADLERLLKLADGGKGPTTDRSPYLGLQRLHTRRSSLVADAGTPPPPGYDRFSHAGTLGFEFSAVKTRLVVNCGSHFNHRQWGMAERVTAAHSTLVVDERNSSEILPDYSIGRKPKNVHCHRSETKDFHMLDLSHDGYSSIGLGTHHRRLRLAKSGEWLEGEDRIDAISNGNALLRFHLHPDVKASLTTDGSSVLLRPVKGSGWRFQAHGGAIQLSDSIYLSGRDHRRSTQIVVNIGLSASSGLVVWNFSREKKAK